jgi:Spy/CpxP family protein refolding chaperone
MPNANSPAGPGKPLNERRDAVAEQEQIDELMDEGRGTAADSSVDPTRSARRAERDAHTRDDNDRNKAPGR